MGATGEKFNDQKRDNSKLCTLEDGRLFLSGKRPRRAVLDSNRVAFGE